MKFEITIPDSLVQKKPYIIGFWALLVTIKLFFFAPTCGCELVQKTMPTAVVHSQPLAKKVINVSPQDNKVMSPFDCNLYSLNKVAQDSINNQLVASNISSVYSGKRFGTYSIKFDMEMNAQKYAVTFDGTTGKVQLNPEFDDAKLITYSADIVPTQWRIVVKALIEEHKDDYIIDMTKADVTKHLSKMSLDGFYQTNYASTKNDTIYVSKSLYFYSDDYSISVEIESEKNIFEEIEIFENQTSKKLTFYDHHIPYGVKEIVSDKMKKATPEISNEVLN